MKLIEDKEPGNYLIFIATGDGRTELHVLRALSKIYDGSKRIYFPKSSRKRKTGLSVLDIIANSAINAEKYLLILDREHILKDCETEVKERLGKMNLKDAEIEVTVNEGNAKLCAVRCKRGSKEITAYIAISGKERKIEENVANLIELEYGDKINPEKEDVKTYLKRKRIKDIETFIKKSHRNSGKRNIKRAFPHIAKILEELEKS